jgi:hypothetical protein
MDKLITYAYMRAETGISLHVPDIKLDKPIEQAQERIRDLMGVPFYSDFLGKILNNTADATYAGLFDPYVKKYLAFQAYELWLPAANVFSSGTGMRTFVEDNSEVADSKTMSEIIRYASQQTGFYKGSLLTYLKDNASLFPLYNSGPCGTSSGMGAQFHITRIGGRKRW